MDAMNSDTRGGMPSRPRLMQQPWKCNQQSRSMRVRQRSSRSASRMQNTQPVLLCASLSVPLPLRISLAAEGNSVVLSISPMLSSGSLAALICCSAVCATSVDRDAAAVFWLTDSAFQLSEREHGHAAGKTAAQVQEAMVNAALTMQHMRERGGVQHMLTCRGR